jgi:hypothetical protein
MPQQATWNRMQTFLKIMLAVNSSQKEKLKVKSPKLKILEDFL